MRYCVLRVIEIVRHGSIDPHRNRFHSFSVDKCSVCDFVPSRFTKVYRVELCVQDEAILCYLRCLNLGEIRTVPHFQFIQCTFTC